MRTAYALQGAAFLLLVIVGGILLSHSATKSTSTTSISTSTTMEQATTTLLLTSTTFQDNESIPAKYTCDGADVSPELHISGVPDEAKSLALIVDDPDAPSGNWDHWVVFDISPTTTLIPEGTEPKGVAGMSTFGKTGYGGPCPGKGEHHYVFKLYELDVMLGIKEGSTKQEVETAMQGHVLAETKLVGLYERKKVQ